MNFEKIESTMGREWVMHIGGRKIPMVALSNFLKAIFFCVSIALCFNFGEYYAMANAQMFQDSQNFAICSNDSMTCQYCVPVKNGHTLQFACTEYHKGDKWSGAINFTNTPGQPALHL